MQINLDDVQSPVLRRLIEEVRNDQANGIRGYDRTYNRHMGGGKYNRTYNRHNR